MNEMSVLLYYYYKRKEIFHIKTESTCLEDLPKL